MLSIKTLISTISQRTAMYIGRNDIFCLQAFINGWIFQNTDSISDLYLIDDFQKWIAARFEIKSTQGWSSIILFYSVDEQHALKQFFELFGEFLESQ